jgi:integrase
MTADAANPVTRAVTLVIRWGWRMLLQLWWRTPRPQEAAWTLCPPNSGELLLSGATAATRRSYLAAVAAFNGWLVSERRQVASDRELDVALFEYIQTLSRSRAENTVAAIERCFPPLRRNLPWSRGLLSNMQVMAPVRHHLPMAWLVATGIAYGLAVLGQPRVGALLLLQWLLGLRPSEALGLKREDITPASLNSGSPGVGVVNLGARTGTKAKRSQAVIVRQDQPMALHLVELFGSSTPVGARLTNLVSTGQYAGALRRGAVQQGLEPRWTPHCPRAGWATETWLAGADFTALREAGRWRSDTSLRVYLDVVAATRLTDEPDVAARLPLLQQLNAAFYSIWRAL